MGVSDCGGGVYFWDGGAEFRGGVWEFDAGEDVCGFGCGFWVGGGSGVYFGD